MELTGLNALVTGGARRLGAAIATALASEDVGVAVHCRHSRAEGDALVERLRGGGARAVLLEADLTDAGAAARLVARAREELGGLEILVNNASEFRATSAADCDLDDLRRDHALHAESPFLLTRELARGLSEGARGAVVNLLDWRARKPDPAHASYSLAKAALEVQTRLLARALAPTVRVNAVAPGAILPPAPPATEASAPATAPDASAYESSAREVPLARTGGVEDVVQACLYLIRDADFSTGVVLPVDGGRHLL